MPQGTRSRGAAGARAASLPFGAPLGPAPLELARRGLGLAALAQEALLERLAPLRRRAAWALFALAVRLEPEIADRA